MCTIPDCKLLPLFMKITMITSAEAPLSTSNLATSRYPAWAAQCKAVQPSCYKHSFGLILLYSNFLGCTIHVNPPLAASFGPIALFLCSVKIRI